jgi:hypothetical protein
MVRASERRRSGLWYGVYSSAHLPVVQGVDHLAFVTAMTLAWAEDLAISDHFEPLHCYSTSYSIGLYPIYLYLPDSHYISVIKRSMRNISSETLNFLDGPGLL